MKADPTQQRQLLEMAEIDAELKQTTDWILEMIKGLSA